MNWKDLGKLIGKHAPVLGTVIGGPAGAAIGAVVASALGVENNPNSIAEAVKNDPQAALRLQEIQNQHEQMLMEYQFKTLDSELKDIQSARDAHKLSSIPAVITAAMTVLSALYGLALFYVVFPEGNRDMINYFGGQLITLWVSSIVYWIGTTRSSAEKNRIIGK